MGKGEATLKMRRAARCLWAFAQCHTDQMRSAVYMRCLPVFHQEGAHKAALPEVDDVVGLHGNDVHRDASPFHVFEGLADLTTSKNARHG